MTQQSSVGMGYRFVLIAVLTVPVLLFCTPGCRTHVDNQILAQSTLYPFHFVENGSELNAVGQYDFDILLKHFKVHSGKFQIRQGDISATLFEERVTHIVDVLKEAGIEEGRINVVDGTPEGEQPQDERVIEILPEDD